MTLNDLVLENIYEELIEEYLDTGKLPIYTEEQIKDMALDRFHAVTP